MEILVEKDHHIATLDNNIITVRNPRGIIGEFSLSGEVYGIWRPESRWEQNTSLEVISLAIEVLLRKGME